ncbi:hypothetical protein N8083_00250 [Candidatus Pacebacteria bacterium]|nr:hypothetical protein [Candidatus Paceibacterota bacterium]
MFRAVGFVIVLYALTQMLSGAFMAFESAAIATFGAFEAAAVQSQKQLQPID